LMSCPKCQAMNARIIEALTWSESKIFDWASWRLPLIEKRFWATWKSHKAPSFSQPHLLRLSFFEISTQWFSGEISTRSELSTMD
jgi:hypothetical protein